jgi:hypothetical protein
MEDMDKTEMGHRLLYDPAATADTIEQVKNFLVKHLKKIQRQLFNIEDATPI